MLGRGVAPAAPVRLDARGRADVHDVAVLCLTQERQASAGHPHQAEHIRLPHAHPFVVLCFGYWVEPERASRVVDEHVDPSESPCDLADEVVDAVLVRDVEVKGYALLPGHSRKAVHASGADHDPIAMAAERDGRG
jgi:hypothetical protein